MGSKNTADIRPIEAFENPKEGPWLTIWIHGTRLTPKVFAKHFFHVNKGLHKASELSLKYQHRAIAQTLSDLDTQQFDINNFYLFGWSDKLSFKQRKQAAKELHNALNLLADYKNTHGVTPRIRIITHSHGGNVALNLAHFISDDHLVIDELVLLACPVQEQTKRLIEKPCFKKLYSFYSTRDMLQVLDPQGMYVEDWEDIDFEKDIFSQRKFSSHPKLKQIEVTYHNRGILHIEFLLINKLCGFIKHLPYLLATASANKDPLQKINLK